MRQEDDAQCTGKSKYATGAKAWMVLNRRHKKHKLKNQGGRKCVNVYRCPTCNQYHIGSSQL